ncbi:MAG TPA: cellulase family glycosylhydrolase, partial [Candidatus Binatus sp.]|nr:cellulase family glycosylhydrolase [Candidatus Binatus sp.]
LLRGYGGILASGSLHTSSGNPASKVFSGETASNTEVTFAELRSRGYNGARVSIIDPAIGGDAASYNSQAWHRTLQLARYYGITLIGDDHEYDCPSASFWQTVFQDTSPASYPNVLWETKNEPHCNSLASNDQAIIDSARDMGDTRWFVLGCNNDCTPSGGGTDLASFPVVTDPLNHVFYDFHEYFFYAAHSGEWTKAVAEAFADMKFQGALDVHNVLGRPFLGTEFGADTGCGDPAMPNSCPPDQTVPGSAGYSSETVAYLSRLITDLHGAGLGYMIWNAGDWNDSPAGNTGAMDTFGSQLPLPPSVTTTPPITTPFTTVMLLLIVPFLLAGFAIFIIVLARRRVKRGPELPSR